ncbi:uncharacterized protein LOC110986683 [Acanthaster planci]|uniref:Uncharacterized protein LOC110986683 n=1 Tax=Acanthaster planci TaxID=133434 RepID=A0A8B7ZMA8_ACAPL|nr:uncharacterized protein LOC110986683 [Acanthaster planci]XP_022104484.1 uncharacterized protein LOC110986683 [Acanthaster planci]XP_022104492.1 uncharacterized protein LOC110986683 [Acanthaster planci]
MSSRVKWVVGGVVVCLILTVIIVVAVTVSKANRNEEKSEAAPPTNDQPRLTTLKGNTGGLAPTNQPGLTASATFVNKSVTLASVAVFTADRLEIKLNCTFQYYVSPENLQILNDTYGPAYELILVFSATDAVKGVGSQFSFRQYAYERDAVEQALSDAVRSRLQGTCCEPSCQTLPGGCEAGCKPTQECTDQDRGLFANVLFFRLDAVDIPDIILSRLPTASPPAK